MNNKKHVILVVDDDTQILGVIEHLLTNDLTDVVTVENISEANRIIKNLSVHLLITDYFLPDGECTSLIKQVRDGNPSLPVIVLTGGDEDELTLLVIESGANFLLKKPIQGKELKGIVQNLLSLFDAYEDLENAQAIITALSKSVDTRDTYTEGHSKRVAEYSIQLYDIIGYDNYLERQALFIGGLLHDIGKIGIPDDILKSSKFPLDEDDYTIIKKHPIMGFDICKDIKKLQPSLSIIKYHHEKLDGSGYPEGLSSKEIPHIVQIVSIADIFDALTTKRSYREAKTNVEALEIMEKQEKGKINDYYFQMFKKMILDKYGS